MTPTQPLTTNLIWPTIDYALALIEKAVDEEIINSAIATMKLSRSRTDIHRFDEEEQKTFWRTLKQKALGLHLYKLGSDGTWRKDPEYWK